jgi:glycerol kinase
MVFDQSARIAAVVQREHEQIFSNPGWVEHDPLEILRRTEEVIAEALEQRGLRASDLAAIGITNQRETTVLWERKSGKPVANAIVWQDTRVAEDVGRFAS